MKNAASPPSADAGGIAVTGAANVQREHLQFAAQSAGPSASRQIASPSMVIRTGDVAVEVASLEPAIAALRKLADSLNGFVGNVAIYTGEHQVRTATLELKIPATRFDAAMSGMNPLGKVERSIANAQDVGEEFVDINARVTNAKRLEARLIALLAARTGKLEDVLAVERELARVREEIERYEGRIRYLSTRVALSTISVTVHEPAPLIAGPGTNIIRDAFLNMWRNFVHFVALAIELLGVAIPLALIGLAAWYGWRRWRVKRAAPVSATA